MKNINPTTTKAWKELEDHYKEIQVEHMKNMFNNDEDRAEKFTIKWEDFYLDYSKNRMNDTTGKLLNKLAAECGLKEAMDAYFQGEAINQTEGRPVLHTALRASKNANVQVHGENVIPEVQEVKEKIRTFTDEVIEGKRKGFTGKKFTDIVNIGIGGSDLGPVMVADSLKFYQNHLNLHFISNVDGDHVHDTIQDLNPETTLYVIVSKTFTTMETISNATTVREWFLQKAPENEVSKHFVAVSTNLNKVESFGIDPDNIFPMWDWVGGRFSLWSAVGLSVALGIGYNNFESLLEGARKMDDHFRNTDFEKNIPVQLALISIWYNNFFGAESEAVIPYSQYLDKFPSYLQQAIMESNGKSVDRNGEKVNYQTGTIIWGEPGTNSQHAFFQLIHQGTKLIPADFIGFKESLFGDQGHHDKLMANYFAQTEALLNGKTEEVVEEELRSMRFSQEEIDRIKSFKVFEGNNPTNTLLVQKLTPESLGKLIAMYEHKIFVQGVIWNIFSYDQWGVELGKQLANKILSEFEFNNSEGHDSSTQNLLKFYMN
ncbi:glucose-6-phosphate isomerase [Gramella sp. Hel_I_59]|uniref:glucose-6-phosphate isomerase n=1 Tax=Gramella sp. Hel_I_59 TaxID=1249978 RepID=UPI001154790B|nr:glucose-6-phosphate isomerase [Gramella sp. Hel_I_59]TQI69500.1 glucose-6-phosphate isomerase [Gramella sp. Hel_I_59]